MRAVLQALAAVLLAGALTPGVVFAHSRLLSSQPAAGAVLSTAPGEIDLTMSEPVSLQFSSISVFDENRAQQSMGSIASASTDGTQVRASLTSTLSPGTYTVVWRVVSGIDGHLTVGSYAFRVQGASGQGSAAAQGTPQPLAGLGDSPVEGAAESVNPARWLLRAIMLGCAALLTGGPLFTLLVLEPVAHQRGSAGSALWTQVTRRLSLAGLVAASILLAGLAVDLAAEISTVASVGFWSAWGRVDIAMLLINTTRYGFAWTMKAIAAMVLVALFEWLFLQSRRRGRTSGGTWEVSIAAASFLLLAESLSSHGAAVSAGRVLGLPLPVLSDWLHLVMAATWVGGLACLALVVFPAFRALAWPAAERRAFLGQAVPRFSRLAVASVIILAVTGVYNLAIQTTDLPQIIASSYGQLVGAKVAIFAVLIGLGAMNLLRLTPRLRARPAAPAAAGTDASPGESPAGLSLRRNVRIELALAGAVLVCAGGLTLFPPPQGAATTYAAPSVLELTGSDLTPLPGTATPAPPGASGPVFASTTEAGYKLQFEASPAQDADTLVLTATNALQSAPPLTDVLKVQFRVTPQDIDAGTATYEGEPDRYASGPGAEWSVRQPIFSHADAYLINVTIQRTANPDLKAAFRVTLAQNGSMLASAEPPVDLRLLTDPSPTVTGRAALTVTLLDGDRNPIENAAVDGVASIPASPGTQVQFSMKRAPGKPGQYTANVDFSKAGAWVLQFHVARAGLPRVRVEASLDVAQR